jgi:molybdenum cofactor cytidylyltransferase
LAAGTSSRVGSPKQLLSYRGLPLLQHAVNGASRADLGELVIVLGHAAEEIAGAIQLPTGAKTVVNSDYATGQSSSLRLGLQSASPEADAAMIFLGDQPEVPIEAVQAVVRLHVQTGGPVVQAVYRGRPGHPVLLDRSVWKKVSEATGDRGAGPLLKAHPEWVVSCSLDLPLPPEVDTLGDLERLRRGESSSPSGGKE